MPCINNASQYITNASLQHGLGGGCVMVVAAVGGGGVQTVFSWLSISYHNRAFTSSLTFNPSLCFRTPIKGLLTLSPHSDLCVLGACVGAFVSASVCVCVCVCVCLWLKNVFSLDMFVRVRACICMCVYESLSAGWEVVSTPAVQLFSLCFISAHLFIHPNSSMRLSRPPSSAHQRGPCELSGLNEARMLVGNHSLFLRNGCLCTLYAIKCGRYARNNTCKDMVGGSRCRKRN